MFKRVQIEGFRPALKFEKYITYKMKTEREMMANIIFKKCSHHAASKRLHISDNALWVTIRKNVIYCN